MTSLFGASPSEQKVITAVDSPQRPMTSIGSAAGLKGLSDLPASSSSVYFHRQPQRIQLGLGVRGWIECPAEPDPPTTLIVWSRDGFGVLDTSEASSSSSSEIRSSMSLADVTRRYSSTTTTTETTAAVTDRRLTTDPSTGALIIDPVTRSDDGIYRCTAYTPRDDSRTTYPIRVVVRDLPYFVVRPVQHYYVVPGQTVTLPCIADGDPKPSIIWRKVNGRFPPSTRTLQDVGNLTIVHLSREDLGLFECIARNPVAGIVTGTMLLPASQHNRAPYDVSVHTTRTSARVNWMPAHHEDRSYHHVLWFRPDGASDWLTLRVVPNDSTSLTLHGLRPSTVYQFTVMARDRLTGSGHYSRIVRATTAESDEDLDRRRIEDDDGDVDPDDEIADDDHDRWSDDESSGTSPLERTGHAGGRLVNPSAAVVAPHRSVCLPPVNVTASWFREHGGGINISWTPAVVLTQSSVNTHEPVGGCRRYIVEYSTVAHWVPLSGSLDAASTSFVWKTASRGATYHFRVVATEKELLETWSDDDEGFHGLTSNVVSLDTGDPMSLSGVSNAVVGAVFGCLALGTLSAFLFTAVACRLYRNRAKRRLADNRIQQLLTRPAIESSSTSATAPEVGATNFSSSTAGQSSKGDHNHSKSAAIYSTIPSGGHNSAATAAAFRSSRSSKYSTSMVDGSSGRGRSSRDSLVSNGARCWSAPSLLDTDLHGDVIDSIHRGMSDVDGGCTASTTSTARRRSTDSEDVEDIEDDYDAFYDGIRHVAATRIIQETPI